MLRKPQEWGRNKMNKVVNGVLIALYIVYFILSCLLSEGRIIPIVCGAMAGLFLISGMISARRKKPSGIYSNIKAPKQERISDLKAYNRAVGRLIMGFAAIFIVDGIEALHISDQSAGVLLAASIFPGAIIMMIVYETVIAPKYINQKKDETDR
jgi:hypothetical protein